MKMFEPETSVAKVPKMSEQNSITTNPKHYFLTKSTR